MADDAASLAAKLKAAEEALRLTTDALEHARRDAQLDRDRYQKALRRLSLAFAIETVGVIFFDQSGRMTDCNDAFLRMTGFTREDLESGILRWDKVTPRDWVETAATAAQEFFVSGNTEPYEREYLRKDGTRWWGLVAAQWLSPDEGVEFVLDVTDRKRAERALANAERAIEAANARRDIRRLLTAAEEEQRKRFARDLHDRLGQHLTAFSLELRHARKEAGDTSALTSRLDRMVRLAEVMTGDARSLALELRPPELDDVGLSSAMQTYLAEWTSRYSIPVDVALTDMNGRDVPDEHATTLYRILQEAMTNIARHAAPSAVSVILERPDGYVSLIIEDDGSGFDVDATLHRAPKDNRYGLAGMRERAELAGGELTIESMPGVGSTIFARLPIREAPGTSETI